MKQNTKYTIMSQKAIRIPTSIGMNFKQIYKIQLIMKMMERNKTKYLFSHSNQRMKSKVIAIQSLNLLRKISSQVTRKMQLLMSQKSIEIYQVKKIQSWSRPTRANLSQQVLINLDKLSKDRDLIIVVYQAPSKKFHVIITRQTMIKQQATILLFKHRQPRRNMLRLPEQIRTMQ